MSKAQIDVKSTEEIVRESLKHGITYADYRSRVAKLVADGKTTGPTQSEALIEYTRLNDRRMKRLDKTLKIGAEYFDKIKQFDIKVTWLVLTESWCGDAAQSMPMMQKTAELNPNINFKIVLRDKHLDLMNRFLYKGTLSIPKLIMIDDKTGTVLGDWGPRPSKATKIAETHKAEHGKLTAEFKQDLQVWYNKDKGQNTLEDLTRLLLENIGDCTLL